MTKAINNLPVYSASDKIWKQIDSRIHQPKIKFFSSRKMSIAASIVGLLGIAIGFLVWNHSSKINFYAVKATENIDLMSISDTSTASFEKIKNATCQLKPNYCSSDEFKNLTKQYDELINDQHRILLQSKISDDENLQQMLLKIENQKKEIQQQMIAMVD